ARYSRGTSARRSGQSAASSDVLRLARDSYPPKQTLNSSVEERMLILFLFDLLCGDCSLGVGDRMGCGGDNYGHSSRGCNLRPGGEGMMTRRNDRRGFSVRVIRVRCLLSNRFRSFLPDMGQPVLSRHEFGFLRYSQSKMPFGIIQMPFFLQNQPHIVMG